MGAEEQPAGVTDDLCALVVFLHVDCQRDLFDAIAEEELSLNQLQLLERLRGGRRAPTLRQVSSMLKVSTGGATKITDGLAKRGLVLRETDDRDYRSKRIRITDRGEAVIIRLHSVRHAHVAAFAGGFDAGERAQLHKLLDRAELAAYRLPTAA